MNNVTHDFVGALFYQPGSTFACREDGEWSHVCKGIQAKLNDGDYAVLLKNTVLGRSADKGRPTRPAEQVQVVRSKKFVRVVDGGKTEVANHDAVFMEASDEIQHDRLLNLMSAYGNPSEVSAGFDGMRDMDMRRFDAVVHASFRVALTQSYALKQVIRKRIARGTRARWQYLQLDKPARCEQRLHIAVKRLGSLVPRTQAVVREITSFVSQTQEAFLAKFGSVRSKSEADEPTLKFTHQEAQSVTVVPAD